MKNVLLVFVLTIMTVQAQKFIPNEVYKTSLASCKLNGNIKKISSKFYCRISNDSILNQWRKFATDSIASKVFLASINEREFSMNGYKTLESQGSFYFKNELVYSSNNDAEDNNNTQQQLAFRLNDSTNIAYKFSKSTHSFIYNKSGNLIQVKQLGFDTINGYGCDFIYNEKGDLIASKFWGNKNSLTNAYENKYDENDRLIEVESYLYWINEFNTSKYKYFSQEKKYEVFTYLNDGNVYIKEYHSFDKDDAHFYERLYAHRSSFRKRHILSRTFKDGTIDFYQYYNDDGKLVTSTKTINKKYNAEDKLIELVTLNELTNKINTQVFEYNYDVNGNIIKQICYDNDGNILLQYINEYEYYK